MEQLMRVTEIEPRLYRQLLNEKVQRVHQLFQRFDAPEPEVFPSAPTHFRQRVELRVWHDGGELDYIMFDRDTREKYPVRFFPAASELINHGMRELRKRLKPEPVLRRKLFQVDFMSTLSDQLIISLLYHRQLDEEWQAAAAALKTELEQVLQCSLQLIGRARKQKIILDNDWIEESLQVHERVYRYMQIENSFTQPNAGVNQKMLEWAVSVTRPQANRDPGDLLELYCGNGNFTLPLAQNFEKVLATEIAKPSVMAANYNIAANQVENVKVIRMSSEEFTQAMNGRAFRRLKDIDLGSYQCNTIFVDPPRSGLDRETVALVQQYGQILYISCNPRTLAENLETLGNTHRVTRFAIFDQFPYSDHVECGVLLQRG
jgi:tRNA (uracil-5-)-methyltransferase